MNIQHVLQFLLPACCPFVAVSAQTVDSLRNIQLQEVAVIVSSIPKSAVAAQPSVFIPAEEMKRRMGHSLMDALSYTEGVHAMDIGVGFSKPMIRGLGFQRIAVTENGIKQEGQQWGADHGLEIDAYNVEGVRIVKGPSSVLYGSDALGGVIEILPPVFPGKDTSSVEALLSYQSVSRGISGSLMWQMRRKHFHTRIRYTERHWADYGVPADSFTYLSMRLPIHNRRLKNTAGVERCANALLAVRRGNYEGRLQVSDSYQKSGFFSGAHGLPNSASLQDDGNSWNIDLPYSMVNHLKLSTTQTWTTSMLQIRLMVGYQVNHREEWSTFHTHSLSQQPPALEPDKELMFHLRTGSAQLQFRYTPGSSWEHHWGVSGMLQGNSIGGYGFLIPAYQRQDGGVYYLTNYRSSRSLLFNASVRFDLSHIHSEAHGEEVGEVSRHLSDYSMALGVEWNIFRGSCLRASVGRAFRLPSVNELTSNGVHHGAFRHELGDSSLVSEQGWQVDVGFSIKRDRWECSVSPFYSYYPHFIALHPTGRWSMLPDAGQIYRYVDAPATLAGGELQAKVRLWKALHYTLSGEYVYTFDHESHTAIPFSPPASMRNTLSWEAKAWQCFVACQSVASQNRVCHNEDATPGYNLVHLGGYVDFRVDRGKLSLILQVKNLLNTSYLNHLNFYRKVELPEAGIDILSTIRFVY